MNPAVDFLILQSACPDRAVAALLARGLVEAGLAACVQVHGPVSSWFRWQGTLEEAEEFVLAAKVLADRYPEAEAWLLEHHPYELPECIAVRLAAASPAFLSWWREPDSRGHDA
jgi:periplasmic divalent cation tolerance protein